VLTRGAGPVKGKGEGSLGAAFPLRVWDRPRDLDLALAGLRCVTVVHSAAALAASAGVGLAAATSADIVGIWVCVPVADGGGGGGAGEEDGAGVGAEVVILTAWFAGTGQNLGELALASRTLSNSFFLSGHMGSLASCLPPQAAHLMFLGSGQSFELWFWAQRPHFSVSAKHWGPTWPYL